MFGRVGAVFQRYRADTGRIGDMGNGLGGEAGKAQEGSCKGLKSCDIFHGGYSENSLVSVGSASVADSLEAIMLRSGI